MAQDGDYPFIVIVWNRFPSTSDPIIKVYFNHFFNGSPAEDIKDWLRHRTDPPTASESYEIRRGDRLGFPLYWGPEIDENFNETSQGETLTITFLSSPPTPYYLWLGPKASYTLVDNNKNPLSTEGGADYTYIKHGVGGENSGIWTFTDSSPQRTQWTLTVKKLVPDPETTNVSIGPDIP